MVYQGTVHNGTIVLDLGTRLAEGTKVQVSPVSNSKPAPKRGSYEALAPFIGIWEDQAEDMDRSLAELRKMKEEEVRRRRDESDPQL